MANWFKTRADAGTDGTRCKLTPKKEALEALASYDMIDTAPEKDFDDIAHLTAEICGSLIAVVNLIGDERQFFKAELGLGVRETPFKSSFCGKAVLEADFLMVPDATKDPAL